MEESLPKNPEEHFAGKGDNSHKFIPMPQAMKMPAARAAVDKEWEKSEVIGEARKDGRKVHSASLMDLCHLKNAELETKHQKYKGRVVLRGDIVKDDSGSYAVFTEQGSSISITIDGCKGHGYHLQTARLRRTSSPRSTFLYSGQNGRFSKIIENSQIGMSRHMDSCTTTQMAKIMVQHG